MKLNTLIQSVEALNKIADNKLPATLSFNLGKFLLLVDAEVKTFEKIRNDKVNEYGDPVLDEEGNALEGQYRIREENIEKYNTEMSELAEQEIDIVIPEISISELKDITIEPSVLIALDWLIKA